jgi:alkylhydroperoxidase family enzyme
VERALEDPETAPIDERVRTMLRFVRKLAMTPGDVTAADIAPLRAQGLSKDAIADVVHVIFLFSTYTRLADTLGWDIPPPAAFEVSAKRLITRGYAS